MPCHLVYSQCLHIKIIRETLLAHNIPHNRSEIKSHSASRDEGCRSLLPSDKETSGRSAGSILPGKVYCVYICLHTEC
jgi:hypothetical protein